MAVSDRLAATIFTPMKYIYLSTENWSPASILIRYGTRCSWSHAGFFNSEQNCYLSAQVKGGVAVRSTEGSKLTEKFSKRMFCTAPGIDEAYAWAVTQIGKPYDWRAILGIAGGNDDWHCGEDYFCSELVASAFEEIGKPLLNPDTVVWRVTPRDLLLSPNLKIIT